MSDETKKMLKIFGVTVTDFEAEAEKLAAAASALSAGSGKTEALELITNMSELCRELGQRWLEITRHVFDMQDRFLATVGEAAKRAQG